MRVFYIRFVPPIHELRPNSERDLPVAARGVLWARDRVLAVVEHPSLKN